MSLHETPAPTPHAEGTLVAFVATKPLADLAATAIRQIKEAGGRVVLVCPLVRHYDTAAAAADEWIRIPQLGVPVQFDDPADRPERWTGPWARTVATNLSRKAGRKVAHRALGQTVTWDLAARQVPRVQDVLDAADVITALDPSAVYIAWRAGQRNQHAAIINGIGPTMEHLGLAR